MLPAPARVCVGQRRHRPAVRRRLCSWDLVEEPRSPHLRPDRTAVLRRTSFLSRPWHPIVPDPVGSLFRDLLKRPSNVAAPVLPVLTGNRPPQNWDPSEWRCGIPTTRLRTAFCPCTFDRPLGIWL